MHNNIYQLVCTVHRITWSLRLFTNLPFHRSFSLSYSLLSSSFLLPLQPFLSLSGYSFLGCLIDIQSSLFFRFGAFTSPVSSLLGTVVVFAANSHYHAFLSLLQPNPHTTHINSKRKKIE